MNKEWKLFKKAPNIFFEKNKKYDAVTLQLLFNRGITTKDQIESFLNPEFNKLHDPFLFRDMEEAVNLTIKHIKSGNKIGIFGDYDADGITSSGLLFEALNTLKAKTETYIPGRVEGYGMNNDAIDKLAKKNVKLIITVDTGIKNKDEVEHAKSLGLDVIVTDHHPYPEDGLPDCLVINPAGGKDGYPFHFLAGVGVAFKFASALINKSKLKENQKKILKNRFLGLVAIGTVSDMVKLFDENRILVKEGLRFLNNTSRPGLRELFKVAGIDSRVLNANSIGFQVGPRLNAAGRLGNATTSFELLITKDKKEATLLAKRLNDHNKERQEVTKDMVGQVDKIVKDFEKDKIIIGVCPDGIEPWNLGLVGLVAGRVVEKYHKPSLVIAKYKDEYRGSGRSIPGFNLVEALDECSDLLYRYGGHPSACGLTVKRENIEKFVKKIRKIVNKKLEGVKLVPKIEIEHELKIEEIDEKLVEKIEKLAPFGMENPEPIFRSTRVVVKDIMTMGVDYQHIKFRFNGFWAVAFGMAEEFKDVKIGDKVDIAYTAEINEFNGKREVQLRVVDVNF